MDESLGDEFTFDLLGSRERNTEHRSLNNPESSDPTAREHAYPSDLRDRRGAIAVLSNKLPSKRLVADRGDRITHGAEQALTFRQRPPRA